MKIEKIGNLTEILSGFAFDSKHFGVEYGMPMIRIRDVVRGTTDTKYSGEYDEKYVVQNGDILIGMDGEFNLAKWKGGPALLNQRVCKIEPTSKHLDGNYLFRFLPQRLKTIEAATPFVTVKHLSVRTIRDIDVPLPPLEEQRRIAEVLDRADALRQKRRLAFQKLDTLLQSVFLNMFASDWPAQPIGEIAEIISGATPKTNRPEFWDGEIQWIAPSDLSDHDSVYIGATKRTITSLGFKSCSAQILPKNSVLFSSRAPIGHLAINTVPMCTNQGFKSMVPIAGKADSRYLYFWLRLHKRMLQDLGNGATFKEVSKAVVGKVTVPAPPIALQIKFGDMLDQVERMRNRAKANQEMIGHLFEAAQLRAFDGELFGD